MSLGWVRSCLKPYSTSSWRKQWRALSTSLSKVVMTERSWSRGIKLQPMQVTRIRGNLPRRNKHSLYSLRIHTKTSRRNSISLRRGSSLVKFSMPSRISRGWGIRGRFNMTLHSLEQKSIVLVMAIKDTEQSIVRASGSACNNFRNKASSKSTSSLPRQSLIQDSQAIYLLPNCNTLSLNTKQLSDPLPLIKTGEYLHQ